MAKRSSILRGVSLIFYGTICVWLLLTPFVGSTQKQDPRKPTQQPRPPQASAASSAAGVEVVGAPCLSGSPDTGLTVQKNESYSAHIVSDGTAYYSNGCQFYVVDVIIPSGFHFDSDGPTGAHAIGLNAGFDSKEVLYNEGNCADATFRWVIYKKEIMSNGRGTAFTKQKGDVEKGIWSGFVDMNATPFCGFHGPRLLTVEVPVSVSKIGTSEVIYRVLALPKLKGDARSAIVRWEWSK